jgi:hypothetical protein
MIQVFFVLIRGAASRTDLSDSSDLDIARWEEYRLSRYETIADTNRESMWCFSWNSTRRDFVINNKRYLPNILNSSPTCLQDMAAVKLKKHLVSLSSPPECAPTKLVTVLPVPFGFGSTISSWVKVSLYDSSVPSNFLLPFFFYQPFIHSIFEGRSFWSPPLGYYEDSPAYHLKRGARCTAQTSSCWFKPLSKCEVLGVVEGCDMSSTSSPVDNCIEHLNPRGIIQEQ